MTPHTLLRLSSAARVLVSGPDCVCWMTESRQGIWQAPHAGRLVSLLETLQSAAELLQHFAEGEEGRTAAETLEKSVARGLMELAGCGDYVAQICRESGIAPHLEERNRWRLGATVCDVEAGEESAALQQAMHESGLPVQPDGRLHVVIVRDYLDPRLASIHEARQTAGVPWMPVKLTGEEIWIGPVFVPGRTACWRCLSLRLRERAWLSSQIAPERGALWTPDVNEGRIRAAAEIAAQEVARWLLEGSDSLEGRIWSFTWANLRAERHPVTRLPNCPDCGFAAERDCGAAADRIELRSGQTLWSPPAALRLASAQELLDRLEPLTSSITGIVRRLERRDLAPSPLIFTYGAVYNVALPPAELRIPGAVIEPGICSGRGWSPEEAKAACVAEAVERYSTQFRGDERRVTGSFREFGEAAIHPNRVLLFSEKQYASREEWNRRHTMDDAVPERFDESEKIEWLAGWSLTASCRRLLPMALASFYYRPAGRHWIGDADSTGCAAGSSFEEAVLHGILELVERDAVSIWWFNQAGRPRYKVRASADPHCRRVCGQLEAQGWRVWAEEITNDLGIPVVVALAEREGGWTYGAAAHLDPGTALGQAMGELWQVSKAQVHAGSPPPGKNEAGTISFRHAEREVDLKDLVDDCCAKIARAGHEVVVFDMRRPEIDFPVVRVVAPGLRPKRPRFAPGRLYEAPVRLGWLEKPRSEEDFPVEPA